MFQTKKKSKSSYLLLADGSEILDKIDKLDPSNMDWKPEYDRDEYWNDGIISLMSVDGKHVSSLLLHSKSNPFFNNVVN